MYVLTIRLSGQFCLSRTIRRVLCSNSLSFREHFLKFANLYLKVGYILGGFQELNSINFELVRGEMFGTHEKSENPSRDEHENDVYEDEEIELSDDEGAEAKSEKKPPVMVRFWKWFKSLFDINRYKADS